MLSQLCWCKQNILIDFTLFNSNCYARFSWNPDDCVFAIRNTIDKCKIRPLKSLGNFQSCLFFSFKSKQTKQKLYKQELDQGQMIHLISTWTFAFRFSKNQGLCNICNVQTNGQFWLDRSFRSSSLKILTSHDLLEQSKVKVCIGEHAQSSWRSRLLWLWLLLQRLRKFRISNRARRRRCCNCYCYQLIKINVPQWGVILFKVNAFGHSFYLAWPN